MDEDDVQWQENINQEFKVRVSSDFDRLVAFATEMNKSSNQSPKREMDHKPPHGDHRSYMRGDEPMPLKIESGHDFPTDLSKERRFRMMMEEQMKNRHRDQP